MHLAHERFFPLNDIEALAIVRALFFTQDLGFSSFTLEGNSEVVI